MSEPVKENKDEADWSKAPKVDDGVAEDFADRLKGAYAGMSLANAKKTFTTYGLSWDTVGPKEFAKAIASLRSSPERSDALGPACFVFCDARVPAKHRPMWVLAVLAARDVHEGD